MHVGVADHLGWAVVVAVDLDGRVVARRRVELVEPGQPVAPVHHLGGAHAMHADGPPPDDDALAAVIDRVRASAVLATGAALDALADELGRVGALALRRTPPGFPADVATMRRVPFESRADPVMYRSVLADVARARGWGVTTYDARTVQGQAAALLGLTGPEAIADMRERLGPPWSADHRMAYAAAVIAAGPGARSAASASPGRS